MHRALPVFRRSGNAASIIAPHSPPFMGLRCMSLFVHDWHNENFMESEPLEAKQKWLSDLQTSHPSVVDVEAHLVVLRGIVNSLKPGSPQRAEEYVFSHLSGFEPTDECYEALLEAWSKSPKEDSSLCVLRAKRWFDKIKAPTLQSYHLLLDVVSKGRVKRSNRARAFSITEDNAKETEKILEAMVSPNTNTYNYVLRKVLNPELSLRKVVHWLSKMEQLQQENPSGCIQPNTKSYAIAMQAYAVFAVYRAKAGKGEGREELEQIEALLKYMQELKNDGFQEIEPNTVAYNILISAHARLSQFPQHQDAPLEAEKVLRRMMAIGNSVYPDHLSFSKVILAWSNSKRPTSGKRAAYWLSKLWELYEASNRNESLRPTVNTYNVVLKAWQNDPKNMEKVFVEMLRIERSEENNNLFLRPNSESFALMIHAWVKVDVSRAVMWLEELMQREKDSTTEWSVTTVPDLFQVIVKNAARDPSVDNLVLGLKVFDYYRSSRHPLDAMSYVWLLELGLKTFSKQENDRDRREFVFDTVNDCCSDGLMSASFVKKLSNGNTYYEGWTIEESRDTVAEIFNHW
eukprot:CAMPEP_0178901710 /NCGR_PEP_ID=MMETSP0786-20121207/4187_1 /TAXON_ID=186022 /ORGANISM="Thalassionema frauenfeldii, Strain CCMP 1798" /LENGTH=572 /DNA_ID=CAMNT_0020572869 /DNA_START=60 /DNA_END=1775 /DNA_ORIENTATION=+